MIQQRDESIQDFIMKLIALAIDCTFICPFNENYDLTDYRIINRILTSIYNETLQQEILQKHAELNPVDLLLNLPNSMQGTEVNHI